MKFWEVGRAIKDRRKEKGFSQEELAAAACMSRVTLSKLESGKIADVSIGAFIRVLDSLGKELDVVEPRAMPTLDDFAKGEYFEK
jgi:transcriptional regulator with XRE-family HTH domain